MIRVVTIEKYESHRVCKHYIVSCSTINSVNILFENLFSDLKDNRPDLIDAYIIEMDKVGDIFCLEDDNRK